MSDSTPRAADRAFEHIAVGEEAAFTRIIGQAEVDAFAVLTGDYNPLHMDEAYAGASRFQGRVAHGMLVAAFFSTLVGMYVPGRRALYLSQEVQFARPVRLGTRVTFRARVRRKSESLRMLELETTALDDAGSEVVRGRAQVQVLE